MLVDLWELTCAIVKIPRKSQREALCNPNQKLDVASFP